MNTNKLQNQWTTVKSFLTPIEAHMARTYLENEGIECVVRDEHSIGMRPYLSHALGGVRLDVTAGDLDRARQLLDVPAAAPEPRVCPKCGGAAFTANDRGAQAASFFVSLLLFIPILLRRPKFKCQSCGAEWRA